MIRVFSTRTLHPSRNFNPKSAARQSLRLLWSRVHFVHTSPPCAPLPRQSPPSGSFSFYRRPNPARSPLSATERHRRRDGVGVKQKYQRLTRGEEVKENNAEKGAKKERTTPLSRSTPRPFKNKKGFPNGNTFLFFHSSARRGPLRFVFPTPPYFCYASSPRPRSPHGSAHGALRCRFAPRVRSAASAHSSLLLSLRKKRRSRKCCADQSAIHNRHKEPYPAHRLRDSVSFSPLVCGARTVPNQTPLMLLKKKMERRGCARIDIVLQK